MNVIEAESVTKKFADTEALSAFTCSVKQGECVGLLGPNGAGKSTFIGATYGVVKRSSGTLKVFGLDPASQSSEIKKRLGVVPQENALDEGLTVSENMRVFARFQNLNVEVSQKRIDELLEYMALSQKKNAPIVALSGGMKRRLAFVRALLNDPELVILDEPTTGLDPAVRHLLWEKVVDLKRQGKTVLVTTHYMHEAEVLCDRVIILSKGKVVASDSPKNLIEAHTPGYVAIFEATPEILSRLKSKASQWEIIESSRQHSVRAPSIANLVGLQEMIASPALQLRPANLEDVFLKLTGEGLENES